MTPDQNPSSIFFVARTANDQGVEAVVGSVYVHWKVEAGHPGNAGEERLVGCFTHLAVAASVQGCGVGSALVGQAERCIQGVAWRAAQGLAAVMEIGVVSVRPELLLWYGRQGYGCAGEIRDNAELVSALLESASVHLVLMRKVLLPSALVTGCL